MKYLIGHGTRHISNPFVIINADDFGYSKIFNEKILELLEKHFITSISIMVEWINGEQKNQVEKLKDIRNNFEVSAGLHIEFKNENFESQIQEQFNKFISIFGFEPDHIDLHKSTYLQNGYPAIIKFCFEKGIPCRNHGNMEYDAITTDFPVYNATKRNAEEIKEWLSGLESKKTYMINFHPGIYDPDSKSGLNKKREADAKNIEAIQPFLQELSIKLTSFRQLSK
jgi:predicted glycoside hydrolase/deacetylase ChbG (UPF0249 family)